MNTCLDLMITFYVYITMIYAYAKVEHDYFQFLNIFACVFFS